MTTTRRDLKRESLALSGVFLMPSSLIRESSKQPKSSYDVVIYGATSVAVTAVVQARKIGKSVIMASLDKHSKY